MIEIRTPTEDDRDLVAEALAVSLNPVSGRRFIEQRAPTIPLNLFRCAFDGDRVLATAAGRDLRQWFCGNELGTNGIWAVTTLPEYRGAGLASRAIEQILHEAREKGQTLTALYPATLRPYRSLGYELAGTYTRHRVPLEALPPGAGPLAVQEYDPADLDDVRACYRRVASLHTGPIDCDDPSWWPARILGHANPDETHRVVVARGDEGGVEGYASFLYEKAEGDLDVSFSIVCKQFVWASGEALRSLLGYFRGFRGIGQALTFTGPPAEPLALIVEEQKVKPEWTFAWMLRLLDVPGALEGRGYPAVSGEALLAVDDPLFADNRGPFRIEADDGKVRVMKAEGVSAATVSIRTLSSMFSGHLDPRDALRLGLLRADDDLVGLLARLFAGASPWMYDFF